MARSEINVNLSGAVVLVTGGARGLGAGIARAFLGAGATVIVCGRNSPTEDQLPSHGGHRAHFVTCDVRQPEAVTALFEKVVADHGRLDVLVNNAGGGPPADMATASPRLIERVIQLNLIAPLLCAQSANRVMQGQTEGGSIINIGSIAGSRPAPGTTPYGAAKAGLAHATGSLAMEWGPLVRVNSVIVGLVASENAEEHYGGPGGVARISETVPMKRMAGPDDVAAACLYLASPLAAYVTGAQIAVHGGGELPLFLHLAKQT